MTADPVRRALLLGLVQAARSEHFQAEVEAERVEVYQDGTSSFTIKVYPSSKDAPRRYFSVRLSEPW